MKASFFRSMLVLAAFGLLMACGSSNESESADVPTNVTETAVAPGSEMTYVADIGIEGMTCSVGCAGMIESKLAAMDGVKDCSVDFENKVAHVSYDNAVVNEKAMVGTITTLANGQYAVTNIDIQKPVESEEGASGASGSDDATETAEESAHNVMERGIKVPNIFDLLGRIYQL